MIEYLDEYLIFLVSLFAIMNPIGVIPIFISLTSNQTRDYRRRISLHTAAAAFVTLTVAYFIGEGLLRFFSTSIQSLRLAGGLIIFATAWSMLQARGVDTRQTGEQEKKAPDSHGIAIVPLAIPLTAGPGAISLMIVAADSTRGLSQDAAAISGVLLASISILILFRSADKVAVAMGTTGISVLGRLMGLILAAIAVELISTSVGEMFPGLLK